MAGSDIERPLPQFLAPEAVLDEMAEHGEQRLFGLSVLQIMVLGALSGGFITLGALFSLLLAEGVETPGAERLLEGLGFSAGFFFVILAHGVLFTEANVVMPATLLQRDRRGIAARALRFWALAWIGNFLGALIVGWALHLAQHYSAALDELLADVIDRKMEWREVGGAGAWFQVVLSGVLANWLVGMAAFFATMGRTIIGKFVPVFLAVTLFVAANFQHSPANMGFFSLAMPADLGPGWGPALAWNIVPAGIGNVLGGTFLVALAFAYAFRGYDTTSSD